MAGIERFGPFEFDPARQELRKHGLRVRVPTQSLRILGALLDHPGAIVSREDIQRLLWPGGTVVAFDQSINAAVKRLRTALGDSAETPRFVERVPRCGYRFIARLETVSGTDAAPPSPAVPPAAEPALSRPWYGSPLALATIAAAAALFGIAAWALRNAASPARRDPIVIADFENKTGDPIFNGALKQALISQMSQSRRVAIVPEDRIAAALTQMRGAPGEPVTADRAREVCQRVGGKAVLAGTVWMLGRRYFVGLDALGCAGGEPLASENAEAVSQERVLAALSDAAGRIRGRLGESLASLRELPPPADATTTSLQALKEYGVALGGKAKGEDVIALLEHSLQLDPEFASAWYTLSQAHFNRGEETLCQRAAERAHALRGRATERERLLIENHYHAQVSGDLVQAIKAGELVAQLYPHDGVARRSAFLPYCKAGEMDKALRLAQQEMRLAPDDGVSYFNLAVVLLARSKMREARQALDDAVRRGLDFPLYPYARYVAALLEGDPGTIAGEEELARKRTFDTRSMVLMAQTLAARGRIAAARDTAPGPESATTGAVVSSIAVAEALFGRPEEAARGARRALSLDRGRRTAANAALALALAGSSPEAQAISDALTSTYPNDFQITGTWAPSIGAAMALSAGAGERALEHGRMSADRGGPSWPCLLRGMAYLQLGRPREAAAEFEKILSAPGLLLTASAFYGSAVAYPAAQAGLARALARQGRIEESRNAYDAFLSNWDHADPDIPLLAEIRRERDRLSAVHYPEADRSILRTGTTTLPRRASDH